MTRRRTSVRTTAKPRQPLPATSVRQIGEAHWELRIGCELKSPNRSIWGGRWALRAVREGWERALLIAIARHGGMDTVAGAQFLRSLSVFVDRQRPERRRVVLTRLVPSARNFVKDEDNRAYLGKSLFDAMKRVGMLTDDKRELLDAPIPTQAVSPDGTYTTVIEIQRLAFVTAPAKRTARRGEAAPGGLL
jgi:hypothetical protein